jgi:N6-L-threonylcarbamoyladenine synthase
MRGTLDFSFSGVKTALLHLAQDKGLYPAIDGDLEQEELHRLVRELAHAFQESVVDVLTAKLLDASERYHAKGLVLGGGVIANARLRQEILKRSPLPAIIPSPILCTDNGPMIAACAYYQYQRGMEFGMELDIDPSLSLG